MVSLEEMQVRIREFNSARSWDQFHQPKELLLALVAEVGELADLYRWLSDEEVEAIRADEKKQERVASEVADVLAFLLMFAEKTGIDVLSALEKKYALLEKRYPVTRARGVHSNVMSGFKG